MGASNEANRFQKLTWWSATSAPPVGLKALTADLLHDTLHPTNIGQDLCSLSLSVTFLFATLA